MTADERRRKALDQVAKLRRLAERTDSQEEAATAAAAAERILAAHDLSELELEGASATVDEGSLGDEVLFTDGRRVSWRGRLGGCCARAHGCKVVWWGGTMRVYGFAADRARALDAYRYGAGLVSALAARQRKGMGRGWYNAYRYGAADAIGSAMVRAADAARTAHRQEHGPGSRALAVVDHKSQALDALMGAFKLRKTRVSLSSTSGLHKGREDGRAAYGRTGLGQGTRRIGAGR